MDKPLRTKIKGKGIECECLRHMDAECVTAFPLGPAKRVVAGVFGFFCAIQNISGTNRPISTKFCILGISYNSLGHLFCLFRNSKNYSQNFEKCDKILKKQSI